jgi:hypothetical protein
VNWLLSNWKPALIALVILLLIWAFTPSCAIRRGAEAERQAQEAIQSANQHQGRADAAEEALGKQTKVTAELVAKVEASDQEKAALTAEVARLRKVLPPRPVVGPGPGVHPPPVGNGGVETPGTTDGALVQQLYDVVDAQAALLVEHVESDKRQAALRESLEKSLDFAKTYGNEQKARGDDFERALVAKDLVVKAMQSAQRGAKIRHWIQGFAGGYVVKTLQASVRN